MINIPFFGKSGKNTEAKPNAQANVNHAAPAEPHPLDEVTGGAFSAATSSERAAKVRAWLDSNPDAATMQEAYKALSARDKGAAKALREKLDEMKRSKGQEALAEQWAAKAEALLQLNKLPIADAMAWQRDAAKAGAPLSKEPLAGLKSRLAARVQGIEDLQTRIQVHREAAVLLAQRIELLSTKGWREADAAQAALQADVQSWHVQSQAFEQDANWNNMDPRYAGQLSASKEQLGVVVQAFTDALAQTREAAQDASKPLPSVPVWADELREARLAEVGAAAESNPAEATNETANAQQQAQIAAEKAAVSAARQEEAKQAIEPLVQTLEQELAQGHSKASAAAAHALRSALKAHIRFLANALEAKAHSVLAKANELESWQRWSADKIRTELVQKAEALIHREEVEPIEATTATQAEKTEEVTEKSLAGTVAGEVAEETAETAATAVEPPSEAASQKAEPKISQKEAARPLPTSPHSPRKLQDMLRQLREQWKQADQGGASNQALWKRFDQACNEAHRIVEVWLAEMKQQAAAQKEKRLALIEELKQWGEQLAARAAQETPDWKAVTREQNTLTQRWREAGHVSEKVFAELQKQWQAAMQQASAPLQAAQKASVAIRHKMIEEATELGASALRIDAIKALQQRWQQEAQRMPLERRQEQKLWDAFRKPIDAAFNRKTQQRQQAAAAVSRRDQAVLDAVQALETANASGDAQAIRQAMQALEAAMHHQQSAEAKEAKEAETAEAVETPAENAAQAAEAATDTDAAENTGAENAAEVTEAVEASGATEPTEAEPAVVATEPKPVLAVRGDDRPSARVAGGHAPRDNKREARRTDRSAQGNKPHARQDGRGDAQRKPQEPRAPRLSDVAFRAQREAKERARSTLRKLAAQAHGETLVQLLGAWEHRDTEQLPAANALGKRVNNAQRQLWVSALGQAAQATPQADEALLRLEMAAEVPTPAEHLQERRTLQLQLLTRRNDPAPAQTWAQDVASVLAAPHSAQQARRLQQVLRVLLK